MLETSTAYYERGGLRGLWRRAAAGMGLRCNGRAPHWGQCVRSTPMTCRIHWVTLRVCRGGGGGVWFRS